MHSVASFVALFCIHTHSCSAFLYYGMKRSSAADRIKLMITRVKMITRVSTKKIKGAWGWNGKPSSWIGPFRWLSLPAGRLAHGFSINLFSRGATWPFVFELEGLKSYFFCHRKNACLSFESFPFFSWEGFKAKKKKKKYPCINPI